MDTTPLKSALEAVLFASGDPVPTARLSLVFGIPEEDVKSAAAELAAEYEANKRGVRLLFLGKTLQLCSASEHAKLISRVIEHRAAPRLSPGALEALAIVAYFQPVTRAYVEQVRGVDSSYTVSSLAEKGLIEPCGRWRPRPAHALPHDGGLPQGDGRELPRGAADAADLNESDGLEKLQDAVDKLKSRGEQLEIDMDAPEGAE